MEWGTSKSWIKLTAILWLSMGVVSLFAQGRGEAKRKRAFPPIQIQGQVRGEQAIQALGRRLPEVAEWYGKTPSELAGLFRRDRNLWVGRSGRLMYACELEEALEAEEQEASTAPLRDPIEGYPLDQTFLLHSLPGSKRVIYLNFKGAVISGTAWNRNYGVIVAEPFSMDGNPAFNNTELQRIQNIWRRVAEDYVPFDVDVTTEEPDPADLTRSSFGDEYYGNTVMITPTSDFYSNPDVGGVSYVGTFTDIGNYYKPSWVFSNNLLNSEKYIAEASSHENGHAVGLHHQGIEGGTAYYRGHGDWAPIMGSGYYRNVTQWARGEYAEASNTEDQLQIIQDHGLDYYPDDHGNGEETASVLDGVTSVSGYGFIEQNIDVDVFQFVTGAGAITINVTPVPLGPNLKILAELRDHEWNLVASSTLPDLGADISETVPLGVYYLAISGTGSGDPLTDGYSDYASLGQYAISGSVLDTGGLLIPPVADISALPESGNTPLSVSFSGLGSSDDGAIVAYEWDFDDGSPISYDPTPVHIYNSAGSYEVTLTVTDNHGLRGSASVIITVTETVYVSSIALSSESSSTSVSADALVTVVNHLGNPIVGAIVTAEWSGIVQGTSSGSTGFAGTASFSSPQAAVSGTITFTVTGVSAPGYEYDPLSNVQTEASIEVNLVDLPLVEITSPSAGDTVSGTILVQVSASSSLGISFVSLGANGVSLGMDPSYPYTISWNTAAMTPGICTLTASAEDTSGGTGSDSINVIVAPEEPEDDIPPDVSIISPEIGAFVSGIIEVSINANDNVGVTKVELYVDGTLAAESASAPFTMEWNADETPGGRHIIQAKAFDAAGNSTVSSSVSVAKRAYLQRSRGRTR